MPKRKQSTEGVSPDKQPLQRAALALAGEPLRAGNGDPPAEPVTGLIPGRRPAGRGQEVSPSEARTIQLAKLTGPTISQDELCRRFGRSRDTIRRVLNDPSFEQLKSEIDATMAMEARSVLASGRTAAAQAWVASLEPAARRGDHRPASALLLHTGVIDPVSHQGIGPSTVVHIGQMINVAVNGYGLPERTPVIDGQAVESENDE